ncbi:MAG: hypothetical protein IKV64_01615, partial [Clostridia bacterium]|nr:hypothetical protein [Clostridia bacterium]
MNNIKWIFKQDAKSHEWYAFKKEIYIEDFNETTIEISSLGRYILYINGKYVARGPVRSFDFAKYYDSIDITAFLNAGKNTVLILSQYLLHEGVYCRICANGQPLCITDESWLAKKYESLDSTTNVCAPPLEPVRCNEECFDARIDEKEKIFGSDNNGWEYADYVHGEFNHITPNLGGLCSEEMAFASKFMGAVSICEKERFGFRIRNLKRQPNPVRKTYSELYVFIVSSESEKDVEFLSNATVSVNGASSKNIAHLKKGDNLFAIYSCKVGVDASVVFRESV